MNSLVALFVLLGAAVAKPSLYGLRGSDYHRSSQYIAQPGAVTSQFREQISGPQPFAYSLPHYKGLHYLKKRSLYHPISYAIPGAVSHQSRVDIHRLPILGHTVIAKPILYAAPAAVSHQSRVDIHSTPIVAEAVIEKAVVAEPVVTKAVVAEPVVAKAVVAEPVIPKTVVGEPIFPPAVSHQSRVDIHSSPLLTKTVIAEPAVIVEPLAFAYPPAVSHQSRFDVHSKAAIIPDHAEVISTYNALPFDFDFPYLLW